MSLFERDKQYVWHPFTQMKTAGPHLPVVKGEGVYLITEDGRKIIDAVSSWWVNIHGHAHPYIAQKLYEQAKTLEHVIFAGFTHSKAVEISERLINDHLPKNQKKIFFSDNGSTAVEVSVKMAMQYWHNQGRKVKKVIALKDAYHGDTFGAMSVSGRGPFSAPFDPFLFEVEFIDSPVPGREKNALQQLERYASSDDAGIFIFEPLIQGAGGMIMHEPEVLEQMLQICRKNKVITIADEVMTGFGRTGKFFATDHIETKPDIMALSKGLTAGAMAMGITSCSQEIYDAFLSEDKMKAFLHGHSFTANPLACAVACASLDLMEKDETMQQINMIHSSHERFKEELKHNPRVENIRLKGTILAFDVKTESSTSYFNQIRDTAYDFFLERNVLLRPLGNVIYILPPYCISQQQLNEVYEAINEFLNQ